MTVDALNASHQKTHYRAKRRKPSARPAAGAALLESQCANSLLLRLDAENDASVSARSQLYAEAWASVSRKVTEILRTSNHQLFRFLFHFIQSQFDSASYHGASCIQRRYKLNCGFISMSSNSGSNLRVLQQFYQYVDGENADICIVTLNSKENSSVKQLFKDLLHQLGTGPSEKPPERPPAERREEDDDDDRLDTLDEDDEPGRTTYDIKRLLDWFRQHPARDRLKLVVVFEDTDSFTNQTVNQFLKLIYPYAQQIPMKFIFALTCNNVTNWMSSHLNNDHRMMIQAFKFQTIDNTQLAHRILNEVFLDPAAKMLVSPTLVTVLLHRFENANNSIDVLINEIKVIIMTFYYSASYAALGGPDPLQHLDAAAIARLRRLPSFKRHIERLLDQPDSQVEITHWLTDPDFFKAQFEDTLDDIQSYRTLVLNVVKLLYTIQGATKAYEEIQIYSLVVNGKLLASAKFKPFLDPANTAGLDLVVENMQAARAGDKDFDRLFEGDLFANIVDFLKSMKKQRAFEDVLLHEIFTYNGGGNYEAPLPGLVDNYNNLMLQLLRPPVRGSLEQALTSSDTYFGEASPLQPIIVKAFNVMNEAPPCFNTYEFFMAFKSTLNKPLIIDEILTNLRAETANNKLIDIIESCKTDESQWEKVIYSWFLQCCHEFLMMGLIIEKPRGDHFERATWKGL